jgi:hypothetical protein
VAEFCYVLSKFLITLMPGYTQNVLGEWCIIKYGLLDVINIAYRSKVYEAIKVTSVHMQESLSRKYCTHIPSHPDFDIF